MWYQFNRWTITLGAQSRALYESMTEKDPERVMRTFETYEAELQHLYSYAHAHHIDLRDYYGPFADIEDRLILIREHIQYSSHT